MVWHFYVQFSSIKFNKSTFRGSWNVTWSQKDGRFEQLCRDASASNKYTDITSHLLSVPVFQLTALISVILVPLSLSTFLRIKCIMFSFSYFSRIRSFQMKVVHVMWNGYTRSFSLIQVDCQKKEVHKDRKGNKKIKVKLLLSTPWTPVGAVEV